LVGLRTYQHPCTSKDKYLKYKNYFTVGKCLMYKNIIRYINIKITIYMYTFLRKECKAYAVCGRSCYRGY